MSRARRWAMLLAAWTVAPVMLVGASNVRPAWCQVVFPVPGGEDYAVELARNTLRIANARDIQTRFHAFLRNPADPKFDEKQDAAMKERIRQLDAMIEMFEAQGFSLRQELPQKQLFQLGTDIHEINAAIGDLERLIRGELKDLSPRLKDVNAMILDAYRARKTK